jgi:hypothetical protein
MSMLGGGWPAPARRTAPPRITRTGSLRR